MSEIIHFIDLVTEKRDLSIDEAARAFQIIMLGGASPAQIAALLTALKMKGEHVDEITGATLAMRARSAKIGAPNNVFDICGTGGDNQSGLLNISTAVSIIVSAAGVPVAKHGNRATTSRCKSADVLSMLGVNIDAEPLLIEKCLNSAGFCFMMTPKFHNAMRNIFPILQDIAIHNLFNIIGPLSNPASVKYHLVGVYDESWCEKIAKALKELGSVRAWVVHGSDGMDELTLAGPSYVSELKDGEVKSFQITPEDAGLETKPIEGLGGGDPNYNALKLIDLLNGKESYYRDIVLYNAAASLYITEIAKDLVEGVTTAKDIIYSGKAKEKLAQIVEVSNRKPNL